MISLCIISFSAISQPKNFSSVSRPEKWWAFFHPCAALKIKKHQQEMYNVYYEVAARTKKENILDTFSNGGRLDAFRHVFGMFFFSQYVSEKKLRKLGRAHEKGNYLQFKKGKAEEGELPDSLSSVMDLRNNDIGLQLGRSGKGYWSTEERKQVVIDAIRNYPAFIMKRNLEGKYLDCNGNIIPEEKIKGKWNVPKCLVAGY